jgi:hypothetical protein
MQLSNERIFYVFHPRFMAYFAHCQFVDCIASNVSDSEVETFIATGIFSRKWG